MGSEEGGPAKDGMANAGVSAQMLGQDTQWILCVLAQRDREKSSGCWCNGNRAAGASAMGIGRGQQWVPVQWELMQ